MSSPDLLMIDDGGDSSADTQWFDELPTPGEQPEGMALGPLRPTHRPVLPIRDAKESKHDRNWLLNLMEEEKALETTQEGESAGSAELSADWGWLAVGLLEAKRQEEAARSAEETEQLSEEEFEALIRDERSRDISDKNSEPMGFQPVSTIEEDRLKSQNKANPLESFRPTGGYIDLSGSWGFEQQAASSAGWEPKRYAPGTEVRGGETPWRTLLPARAEPLAVPGQSAVRPLHSWQEVRPSSLAPVTPALPSYRTPPAAGGSLGFASPPQSGFQASTPTRPQEAARPLSDPW